MSRRTLLSLATVPVVILFTAALTASRSEAAATPGDWPGARVCAQGTLTAGERTAASPARTPLVYRVPPCADADPATVAGARWGVALYFAGGSFPGTGAYIDEGAVQPFQTEGDTTGRGYGFADGDLTVGILGEIQAACLVTGAAVRVACVSVNDVGAAGTIDIDPIPVDDALVNRPVRLLVTETAQPDAPLACSKPTAHERLQPPRSRALRELDASPTSPA